MVREAEETVLPLLETCSLFDLALISLVAGVGEEALFRGVIQMGLANSLGPWGAIVVTAMLFGLVHFITPTYAVLAGLIGVYFGWLMTASENLLLPIVVHVLYDFLALTYVVREYKVKSGG
jgi:membrane protease YdiL (CAAX protease family)